MTNELELVREGDEALAVPREGVMKEGPPPCFVRVPDAGGHCKRPSAMRVYGLAFCEAHGLEIKLGALQEAYDDAENFFERLRNPHVPRLSGAVREGLDAAFAHLWAERPWETAHDRALAEAYDPPENVRERDRLWMADEQEGYAPVYDSLMEALRLCCKLMRVTFEEGGPTWLLEALEEEREGIAAQAAAALAERQREEAGV